jgi:hypothetical protein
MADVWVAPDSPPNPNEGSDFGRKQKVVVVIDDKEATGSEVGV